MQLPLSNGGLTLGSQVDITWTVTNVTSALRLVLFRNGVRLGIIANDLPVAQGHYRWTAGQYQGGSAVTGGGYVVRLRTVVDGGPHTDTTAFNLTVPVTVGLQFPLQTVPAGGSRVIAGPGLLVDSPRTGDVWLQGDAHDVTWHWVGVAPGDPGFPAKVTIYLRNSKYPNDVGPYIAINVPNTGVFRWTAGWVGSESPRSYWYSNWTPDDRIWYVEISANSPIPGAASFTGHSGSFRVLHRPN